MIQIHHLMMIYQGTPFTIQYPLEIKGETYYSIFLQKYHLYLSIDIYQTNPNKYSLIFFLLKIYKKIGCKSLICCSLVDIGISTQLSKSIFNLFMYFILFYITHLSEILLQYFYFYVFEK